ncbi:MAG: helix-turn-helix transcriptional regulator [Clostridia bacterium]|nr:helix-turn-helix transcriptional regulator [Clostridia bacterium]
MEIGMSLDTLPTRTYSSFRRFEKHERHMTRVCTQDVLVMVFEGVLRFLEDGKPVEVHAGEYYIQRRGLKQEGTFESDSPAYYFIHFSDAFYTDKGHILPLCGRANFKELYPLFKKLDELYICRAPLVEKASVVYQILMSLKNASGNKGQSTVVTKVLSAVAADLQKPFSLQDIAKECGYNKNHVIRIFKSETGKTPYAYVTEIKVNKAKQLLLGSDASLSQISIECGFGDYINLYKAFVKSEGCPPLVWKKQKLGDAF